METLQLDPPAATVSAAADSMAATLDLWAPRAGIVELTGHRGSLSVKKERSFEVEAMRRHVVSALLALIALIFPIACSDGGGVLDNGTVEIGGTWSVRVTSPGSVLTDCQGVTLVPDPAGYRGLLAQAESAGTISVAQNANRLTIRPVVDAQPSGLTATFSGDGSLAGSTVVATIELELTDPGRRVEVQSESVRGSILGPSMLSLTADRWSVDTGGCAIDPPIEYEILIQ